MAAEAMDEKFFEKILRRGLNDETIRNVTIRSKVPATTKGANFLSDLWRYILGYRCSIEMTEEREREVSLIIKCEPNTNGPALDLVKEQNIFDTEIAIFANILPETERLVGRRISPKCFYASKNHGIVILEDLQPLGFATKNRQIGLPMDHVLVALECIATFHAASVRQCERNPDTIKSFTKGILTEMTPKNMFRVFERTLRMISERMRDSPDPKYRVISDKLLALEAKFLDEILGVTDYTDTEFCVLNHGDCWINNLMFREDSQGKPLQVMLIDFQMSVYSSPVIDLVYFLSICPELELKVDKDDFFLAKYLETLTRLMNDLGCKTRPPTLEELRCAMLKRRMWIILSAVALYPRMIADATEVESFDELLISGETKMDVFKNPTAAIALKKFLSAMEKRGYLD